MTTQIVCGTLINIDQLPNRQSIVDVRGYLSDLVKGTDFKIVEVGDRRLNYHEMDYFLSYNFPSQMALSQLGKWIEKVHVADVQNNFESLLRKMGQTRGQQMVIQAVYTF